MKKKLKKSWTPKGLKYLTQYMGIHDLSMILMIFYRDAALTYLARYLYRSVISEQNILRINNGKITFQYKESKSKQFKTITETATAFFWRILQHVLPKGFRRARNYVFLHGNAKATLQRLQLILKVRLPFSAVKQKKTVCCPKCQHEMQLYIMRIGTRLINIGSPI